MGETATGSGRRDATALSLIAGLYGAAIDRSQWSRFAAELSEAVGGASVTLTIRRPETRLGWDYFGSHDLAILVAETLQGALLRAEQRVEGFRHAFLSLGEAFPRIVIEQLPFFQQKLAPHGIAPLWPLCHAVSVDGAIRCWILLQPPAGACFDPVGAAELGAQLVPHLARAFALHRELGAQSHKQRALEEVLDRLPAGVLLIDASRRVIHANLSAQRMIALDDGIALREERLCSRSKDDAALQAAIDAATDAASRGDFYHVSRTTVASRSGRRPFLLSLTPLLRALPGSPVHEAVAVVFLASPDAISSASVQALEAVYGLTAAEAAIVQGLVEGLSLDQIAAQRRVKPDTARTQLKQVFAKTRTSRQPELIRLVLTGIAPLSQSVAPAEDDAS